MKNYQVLLLAVAGTAALAGALWFKSTFSVLSTSGGDEYLIVRAEQAKECEASGGCAIFSERELFKELAKIMRHYRSQKEGL